MYHALNMFYIYVHVCVYVCMHVLCMYKHRKLTESSPPDQGIHLAPITPISRGPQPPGSRAWTQYEHWMHTCHDTRHTNVSCSYTEAALQNLSHPLVRASTSSILEPRCVHAYRNHWSVDNMAAKVFCPFTPTAGVQRVCMYALQAG
jgi:hypothetical protein